MVEGGCCVVEGEEREGEMSELGIVGKEGIIELWRERM